MQPKDDYQHNCIKCKIIVEFNNFIGYLIPKKIDFMANDK
jgi:hypothetical protein